MTTNEFLQLTLALQLEALMKKGIMVANRYDTSGRYFLFQVDDFYVELKADKNTDKIKRLICFSNEDRLSLYMEKVDVSSLFGNINLN